MKIKSLILVLAICIGLPSCLFRSITKPKDFTYLYYPKNVGLDTLLNIDGCFVSNDTSRFDFRYIVFWQSNLVCLSYFLPAKNIFPENQSKFVWGTYIVEGKTIKIQNILYTGADGGIIVNPYVFKIKNRNEIILIDKKDSLEVSEKNKFIYTVIDRIDSTNWLLKKSWFYEKKKSKN